VAVTDMHVAHSVKYSSKYAAILLAFTGGPCHAECAGKDT